MLAGLTITILVSLDAFLVVWIIRKRDRTRSTVGDRVPASPKRAEEANLN
jgi:hypothetical protein